MAASQDPELDRALTAIRSRAENLLQSIVAISLQSPQKWKECMQQFSLVLGQFRSLSEELCRTVGDSGPLLLDTHALLPQSLEGLEGKYDLIPENFRSRLEPAMEIEDKMCVDTAEKEGWVDMNNDASINDLKTRMDHLSNLLIDISQEIRADIDERGLLNYDGSDVPPVELEDGGSADALLQMQAAIYRGEGLRRPEAPTPVPSTTPTPMQQQQSSANGNILQPTALAAGARPGSGPNSAAPSRQSTPGAYIAVAPSANIHVQQQQQQMQMLQQSHSSIQGAGAAQQVAPRPIVSNAPQQYASQQQQQGVNMHSVAQQLQQPSGPVQRVINTTPVVGPPGGVRYQANTQVSGQGLPQTGVQPMRMAPAPQIIPSTSLANRGQPSAPTIGIPQSSGQLGGAINPNLLHRPGGMPPNAIPKTGVQPMHRPGYPPHQ